MNNEQAVQRLDDIIDLLDNAGDEACREAILDLIDDLREDG